MAELESQMSSFSIIETEHGLGNPALIEGLLASEGSTEELEEIGKEKNITTTVKTTVKKEEPRKEEKKEVKKPEDKSKVLKSFLTSEEGEEEGSEEEGEETKDGEGNEEPEKVNHFSALTKDLLELGVFTKGEDEGEVEINSPQEFLERFNSEKQKGAQIILSNFLAQFGEDYQDAFQAIYVNGVDPKEYFTTYNTIADLATLDLKVEENQIAVIKQGLLDQGFEAADIPAEIERLKNYGDLENVSNRYHKALVKKQTAKLEQSERESAQRVAAQKQAKINYIKSVQTILQDKVKSKEFDGIPLNSQLATELQDYLVTEKYRNKAGESLTEFDRTLLDLKNPENYQKRVKVALLLKVLEKDPTLSTIQKTGVTKKTDQLFNELARQTSGKSGVKTEKEKEKPSSKSWFS